MSPTSQGAIVLVVTLVVLLSGAPVAFGLGAIALGSGAGAEARRPLGIAVVGGLAFSQIITLYVTPVLYTYMDSFQKRLANRTLRQPAPRPHAEPGLDAAD